MGASLSANLVKRAALVATLALLLQACSTVKLAYNRIDWFVLYHVRGHVSLTDEQTDRLEQRLATFRRWHCETQLAGYARWLRAVNDDVQAGNISYAAIKARDTELLRFWRTFLEESAGALAELLPPLTEAQVEEYFHNLERDNRRLRSETLDQPPEKRRERSREWMEEQLERWFGELTAPQQQTLTGWSEHVSPSAAEDRIAAREAWQEELHRVLKQRGEPANFRPQLRRLLVEPEYLRSVDYLRYRAARREQTLQLLADIGATLTPAQRRYFASRTESWARDFDELSCADARRALASTVEFATWRHRERSARNLC